MTKQIAVFLLGTASIACMGQVKESDRISQLQNENAVLRLQVSNLQSMMIRSQANDALKTLESDHAKAVSDLERLNPGMKWDDQQGKLVPADKKANASH
jgi:hypothetical protein